MLGTIEAIYARCVEEGDCWIWTGAMDGNNTPVLRLNGSRSLVPVRRHILEMSGKKIGKLRATNTCDVRGCVNPEHAVAWTMAKLIKRSAIATGYARRPSRNSKISGAARSRSPLTPELVKEIRESPETGRAVAIRLGLCQSTVQSIRAHDTWRDYSSPFFALAA